MNKKSALEFDKLIGIVIAVLILTIIITYFLIASGGPKDLIEKILGVMNSSTENVITSVN